MSGASQRTRRALAVLAPKVLGMLGLPGILGVIGAPRLRAETIHLLHFDDLAEGRTFRTRSQPYAAAGVTIHGTGEFGGSVPTVIRPAPGAGTPPHCLVNDYAYGSEFGSVNQDLVIDLDGYTADFVSADAGLAED